MLKAIPTVNGPEHYGKNSFVYSEFVVLKDGEFFDVKMQYPLIKMENAVKECYVRKEVFEKLKIAQNNLPQGYALRIWDAWRPFLLQQELYEKYSQDIILQFNLSDAPADVKQKTIAKYVSIPVKSQDGPVHTTGGAVDVTLIKNGKEVFMGTDFDTFSEKTTTDYFEINRENDFVRDNRRILYNAMISAGFTNLPSEWWHYDYGDKFWAYYNNIPTMYEGIYEIEKTTTNKKQ